MEAIHFGVVGYGTCQELLTLRHKALRYSPDIVILTFTSGNDVYNNSKALNLLDTIPYFVVQGDALVLDDGFLGWYRSRTTGLRAVYQSLLDRSSLLQLVKSLRYRSQRERRAQEQEAAALKTGGDAAGLAEAGLADRVYVEPTDETWRQAWDVTERIIVATRDEASQAGSRFLLVSVTNGIQVHPDPAVRKKAAEALRVADLTYPERRLAALAERTGIPYLALAPILQSHAEESGAFLHGFGDRLGTGHWNAEGHRIAGQLIARTIAGEILPKPPR